MGRVIAVAKIENVGDLHAVAQGTLANDAVRRLEIPDALVDSGATGFCMPKTLLEKLGLQYLRTRTAKTSAGPMEVRMFGTVRLTVDGRDCPCDVTELPDGCPVLIGQIPLEAMDFVIDMTARKLIGNPDHGGDHIIELY